MNWYDTWHKHPRHKHAHWLFFFATLVLVSSFLFGKVGEFYLENEYQAQAQAALTLGVSGDKFTVNGQQKFLLMVSYFSAMDASDATLDTDFSTLRSLGFSGVRIFPIWGPVNNRLFDTSGNIPQGMMARFTNILQKAQNNNLIVDVSFTGDGAFALNDYINGIVSVTNGIRGFRNLFYDIQNEADHFFPFNCGSCPPILTGAEAQQIKTAIKAADAQRIVSVSLISGMINASYQGGMDFTIMHGPFGNMSGTTALYNQARSAFPGTAIHFQEPDRCRDNPCRYAANEFITAAVDAKCAGAAGWNFHTSAGYNLAAGSMFSQWLDPGVENAVASGISAALASACGGGPPPPPPPGGSTRTIYYLDPYSAPPGTKITIAGQYLANTVNFYNASRTLTTATGTLNRTGTELTVSIPNLAPGLYMVSVGPPDSNEVKLEIIASLPTPTPGGTGANGAEPCTSDIIQLGVSIICDFYPETVYPGDSIQMTGVALTEAVQIYPAATGIPINITGVVSNNGQLVTFTIPSTVALGNYSIGDSGTTGNATITKTLSIINPPNTGETPPPGPNPPFPPPVTVVTPPATPFQDLIANGFNYSLIVVGIAVFIMIMWGGFLWLTSAANPGNISTAKKYIANAILGAVLLVSAYAILYTINPELVAGTFNLPGQRAPSSQSAGSIRLIATSEAGAASAITAGCNIDIDTRDFTALSCDSDVANNLNLPLDPVISTGDTGVNNQIGATTLQNGGNLGAGRRIVVLDSGYNYNNPDLSSSYLGGKDFINNDNDPMDDNTGGGSAPGHGSHVAGIITGDGVNSRARGVAPQTGIISGKVLDASGNSTWSKLMDAIYWAVNGPDGIHGTADDFNADAINISIGGGSYSSICDNTDETTRLMAKALQYARDNGVLPVIAAGNSASGVMMPGCIDAAFTVGAVDSSDRIAYFSGRGTPVDIVAPGVNLYSTLLGSNYGLKSGTSMATPVVSGAVALLKAANPNLNVSQLEQAITSTACDLGTAGKDPTFGWGRVTVTPGSCTAPPPPPPPSGPTGTVRTTPTSCTKGVNPANPNCDTLINYTITGITSATQLVVGKDGNLFQNIQCAASPCSGQLTDSNPAGGLHQYDFRLPNYTIIARGNSYIYTTGNITANFGSCTQMANNANPNCDVTLSVSAPGVSPNSILITKDGSNWRLVPCGNAQCTFSLTDAAPAVGTHTYTIQDASDNTGGRLGRVTVIINPPAIFNPVCNVQSNEIIELCSGTNYTGTCAQFNCHDKNNFNGSAINGLNIRSARIFRSDPGVSDARIYTCDAGWLHPNPSATEPTPCLWLDINSTNNAPDIWNPANNNWCYWTFVNSTRADICGQPVPATPGINIKSYGSM